jgi:signal peptidase I
MNSSSPVLRSLEFLRKYSEGIVLTLLLALIVRLFVFSSVQVSNDHMAPNLLPGDYALAYRLPFGLKVPLLRSKLGQGRPRRGELVLFPCPESSADFCVSRVIGLPGDRVEIRAERLILNGTQAEYSSPRKDRFGLILKEKWDGLNHEVAISGSGKNSKFGPVIVGPGRVFVLSDHRDLAKDSRAYGSVAISNLEARVGFIWVSWHWPNESSSVLPDLRWSRVFKSIQ